MANTVIVYGPQGCGKTTNAEALRKHFGCEKIVDEWSYGHGVTPGALHLTNDSFFDERTRYRALFSSPHYPVYRFEDAAARLDIGVRRRRKVSKEEANRLFVAAGGRTNIDGSPLPSTKESNPKDGVGVRKWRQFVTVPLTVIAEVGVAMLEGHLKGYRRHNYRVAGVRASVYVDAAMGHIAQWWEGEDYDPDVPGKKLSHITKAIASLVVLRDATIQDMLTDDRPPRAKLDKVRDDLQCVVDAMFEKYPDGAAPYTEVEEVAKRKELSHDQFADEIKKAMIEAESRGGHIRTLLDPGKIVINNHTTMKPVTGFDETGMR